MDIAKIMACLKDRGFNPHYIDNSNATIELIKELISENKSIGFGGSKTVEDLGIPQSLHNSGYTTYHRLVIKDISKDELYHKSRDADWYITSSNALTEDGQLVNIDGRGNRISSMIYGPKNVLVVIGMNKITKDLESAIDRVKNIAAPLNAKRFNLSTPCTVANKCMDCSSIERICRATMILTNPTFEKNFHIIIVNENLGY